jgi:hypothetical protein
MAKGGDVLGMLCPDVEWKITDSDYDQIDWFDKEPAISRKQFEAGFPQYEAWKAEQDSTKATQKAALLDRLGITEEEAKLLLA